MKSITLSLTLILFLGFSAHGQKKVKERDLKGHWQMVLDIDDEFIEQELDVEDVPWLGRIIASGVTEIVFEIIDEIDITFEFQENNRLKIMVNAFGEEEVEYAKWHIDSKGGLVLDDDDQDDDVWLFDHGKLYAYEKKYDGLERQPIYLKRVH